MVLTSQEIAKLVSRVESIFNNKEGIYVTNAEVGNKLYMQDKIGIGRRLEGNISKQ